MSGFLLYPLALILFIFTLGLLVLIHEFGHYITAKKFGIKVLEFGFGIPPRAWGKKIKETIYSINWLPIGGFVKLLGEDEDEKNSFSSEKEKKEWTERSFATQAVWKRIVVVIAGVFMNLLLAWVLFYGILLSSNFKIIYPALEPIVQVGHVEPGFPAYQAHLQEGDRIVSMNGKKIKTPDDVLEVIKNNPDGQPIDIKLSDVYGSSQKELSITPKDVAPNDKKIGIGFAEFPFIQYKSPQEKIFSGIRYSWDVTVNTFLGLGKLFGDLGQGDYSQASQKVAGPVGLAVLTKDIVSFGAGGFGFYVWFVGILSLTLAIFNVLPIPALDGGRLFFLLVELVTRKKVNPGFERAVHTVGMVVLLMLLAVITVSDIQKTALFGKLQHLIR